MTDGTELGRVNRRSDYGVVNYRVDGTSAYVPEPAVSLGRERKVSRTVARNRSKAKNVNRAYVLFLAVISVAAVMMCIRYLNLKETLTAQASANERLESQLATLRSENDALLEAVSNDVDWNYIRETAVNKLGMKYAAEDQIVWYNTEDCCFVRQYRDVPAS